MFRLLMVFMLLITALAGMMPQSAQAQEATPEATPETTPIPFPASVAVHDLEIDLGGFVTKAQLTFPSESDGPFPTVILFHGSGPYDMDASYLTYPGQPVQSANFRLLAERLPQAGIAVLRFNKRGVLGLGEYDFQQAQLAGSLDQLVADANTVIDFALQQPEVDADQLYLFGWSEGVWVITNAAQTQEEAGQQIAGLIYMGAPDGDLQHVLEYQWLELALPYLAEEIDENGDGALSIEEAAAIPDGSTRYMANFFLFDQTSTPDALVLSTVVNTNGDDVIDLEAELRPTLEQFIGNYPLFVQPGEASHDTSDLVQRMDVPVLILHGENDGWTPLADAQQIAESQNVTLNVYEGLGHALSDTPDPAEDDFGVMDDAPIEDLIAWVLGRD
ncbi:MAG: alpha/beta hydrolase [bacterium]|nr:alpha/beta hydrolase [bacterium]